MSIVLDRDSDLPLHSQISAALRGQIERGELAIGARLPSSRNLAELVGVNRTTVVQSYRELKAAGLIQSDVGRGSFVSAQASALAPGAGTKRPAVEPVAPLAWGELLGAGGGGDPARQHPRTHAQTRTPVRIQHTNGDDPHPSLIPLARAVANPELYPVEEVRREHRRAMDELGKEALCYAPPAGYEPLRESLRRRFAVRGIDMSDRDVLIVGGSQQGIDLVSRLLPEPASILTSTPTFSGALKLFSRYHDCVPVPFDERGLVPEGVEDALRALRPTRPRLLYTLPFCHNPTGVAQDPARGERLLALAGQHGLPILEDDWLGDLRTEGDPPPLATRDSAGHVLYLGTASKVLVPGLRLGWIVAPREAFARLLSLKADTDLATNLPAQAALQRMLDSGAYDSHAERMRRALERRRLITLAAIEKHFPAATRPLASGQGMVLWVQLPQGIDQGQLVSAARAAGLEIAAGHAFVLPAAKLSGFRISYAEAAEQDLGAAIATLGSVLHQSLRAAPLVAGTPLV